MLHSPTTSGAERPANRGRGGGVDDPFAEDSDSEDDEAEAEYWSTEMRQWTRNNAKVRLVLCSFCQIFILPPLLQSESYDARYLTRLSGERR